MGPLKKLIGSDIRFVWKHFLLSFFIGFFFFIYGPLFRSVGAITNCLRPCLSQASCPSPLSHSSNPETIFDDPIIQSPSGSSSRPFCVQFAANPITVLENFNCHTHVFHLSVCRSWLFFFFYTKYPFLRTFRSFFAVFQVKQQRGARKTRCG